MTHWQVQLVGWICLAFVWNGANSVWSKEVQAASPKPILLWPKGAPGAKGNTVLDKPQITVYLPTKEAASGTAVVVCPGGGYQHLAKSYEGHDVARWLAGIGVAGIVLEYRLAPRYRHPYPLTDAQRAIRLTRANAKKWGIDPRRIGILGFSAGGHLASTAVTHFDSGNDKAKDPVEEQSCRPDFGVLVYAVISLTEPYSHFGSRNNLLGPKPDAKLAALLSSEKQVTAKTPPVFLVHTTEDTVVPPENAVAFYLAMKKAKQPVELHIYEKGRHGLGLGAKGSAFASWPRRLQDWLRVRGFLK